MFNFPIKIAMLNHLKIHQFWDRPIRFCWYMHQALPPPSPPMGYGMHGIIGMYGRYGIC